MNRNVLARRAAALVALAVFGNVLASAPGVSASGAAPGGPGASAVWAPGEKSFLGTSATNASRVYFTGYRGIVSEVFYPVADTANTVDLQFMVGDAPKTFVDEEKLQTYSVTQPNTRSMRWSANTSNTGHNWSISKNVFTDPARNTLVMRVTFNALNGKTIGDFNLYTLHNPSMDNSGGGDTSRTLVSGGRTMMVASQGTRASALAVSKPWKLSGGLPMVSSGFVGASDGWTDLLGGASDKTMTWNYDSATSGNVAQMGWIDLGTPTATTASVDVVLGFGTTETEAMTSANGTLGSNLATMQTTFDSGWQTYTNGLSTQGGTADNQYYLAAMALKSIQDKSNGAMIAGMGTPWGETNGDSNNGGYHLVWSRDLFKFANALLTAGDVTSARDATTYMFNTLRQSSDCGVAEYNAPGCPQGYSRIGRFPQNAWVSGWQYWQGTQMDEQAMPIILAWRTYGKGDAATKTTINALWPKIKQTADFIVNTGPWTHQERWEEQSGYSPSTIAAEVSGLVAAAEFAKLNSDTVSAAKYLAAADRWQQRVDDWTFTTAGPHGDGQYYVRINPATMSGGTAPLKYNPTFGPNTNANIQDKNGGGLRDQKRVVDGGFLELVRMGVRSANDSSILATIPEYDLLLKQTIPGKGDAWFRYNYDGYGEKNDGSNFDGSGRGRLWPIFTAERGMYEIAKSGLGSSGTVYKTAVKAFSSPQGFVSEQVWNNSVTIGGDWVTTLPAGYTAGTPTKSMSPLNWAMGEYISLLASISAGKIVDILPEVCDRYSTCVVTPPAGQSAASVNATASTTYGQQMYVTGNTTALGNWNTDLAVPLDPATYPVWKNTINLPASTVVQYKYFRKNDDGTVTWETIAGGGNRSRTTAASGTVAWNDTIVW
ncbi:MAG: glucoamylase [Acidimicrobiaceae bacterium]|jgi:glucoamylase|nr:MAG: glucoamylase [Acidimicrobiaceae bacterium]